MGGHETGRGGAKLGGCAPLRPGPKTATVCSTPLPRPLSLVGLICMVRLCREVDA